MTHVLDISERRPVSARTRLASALLLLASVQAFGAEGLTFNQALQLALRQSPELRAESARVEAAQQAEGPADALPDPTLILGLDNVPVDGADRYSLSSDFMTMQRIGVTQRFPIAANAQQGQKVPDSKSA